MFQSIILPGILIPAFISLIINFISWSATKKDKEPILKGFWGLPLAMGLAYITAQLMILGKHPFPPVESTQWQIYSALIMIFAGVLDSLIKLPLIANVIMRLVASASSLYLILMPMIKNTWSSTQSITYMVGLSILTTIYWFLLEMTFKKTEERISNPITLGLLTVGIAVLCASSRSVVLGQLTGTIGAAIASIFLVAILKPSFSMEKGASAIVVLFSAILTNLYFYAEVKSLLALALILIAPFFSLITLIKPIKKLKTWQIIIIRSLLVIIPMTSGLLIDYSLEKDDNESDYYQ